ncbi:class I SAM-dependent methyltransferase [bacterium]|nr:class I SAM-dependent methyltransferase [bacterium]
MANKRDFDNLAATWDDNPGRISAARGICEAIRREVLLSDALQALDYGCGTGLVTLGLQPGLGSIVAADSSEGMLRVLQDKLAAAQIDNVRTLKLDLEHEEPSEGRYDLIFSSLTMHHLEHPGVVIGRLAQMLQAGGVLAIVDLDKEAGDFHADNTGVAHFGFSAEEMQEMLRSAGLMQVRTVKATTVTKPVAGGVMRNFDVLLTLGIRG